MIKKLISLAAMAFLAASCTNVIDNVESLRLRAGADDDVVFYATIEGQSDAQTKVFADCQLRVLWNKDDCISLFNKTTGNQQFRFQGNDGDNAGSFKSVSGSASATTLDHIYALYPYSETTTLSVGGVLSVTLPDHQAFRSNSFGNGANAMVAVTDNNQLLFKNVGGYLSLKFYGDGVAVQSIVLKGNNGEKLAGPATVTMDVCGMPTVAMQNGATESITLTCETPVTLGATASDYTEFWFVVPPTTFVKGFTVTVTDSQGGSFEMSTAREQAISRNKLNRMSPVEVIPVPSPYQAVDLGLSVKWATCNVGAERPEEYGEYFAWGETESKTEYSLSTYRWYDKGTSKYTKYVVNSKYGTVDGKSILDEDDDAAHVHWGGNWRMPTSSEIQELINNCDVQWTKENGVYGQRYTSKLTGFTHQSIFIPASGYKSGTNDYTADGETGRYWSSSLYTSGMYNSNYLFYYMNGKPSIAQMDRYIGHSVRPVMDSDRVPVNSVSLSETTIYLKQGDSKVLTAAIFPDNATYRTLTWSSSVPAVASVENGKVTAVSNGSATITATTPEGISASCKVIVQGLSAIPESVDLGLSVNWATFNVGASAPEESGYFFSWGETLSKNDYSWASYKWYDASSNHVTKYNSSGYTLDPQDDAAFASWGEQWRMPTKAEIDELVSGCTWVWETLNDVPGYRVSGKKEGYTQNSIFIPAVGIMDDDGPDGAGVYTACWCSRSYNEYKAYYLYLSSKKPSVYYDGKYFGLSIRPVRISTTGISISRTSMTLTTGNTGKLTGTVYPANAPDNAILWESFAPDIATVSSDGLVTAIAPGKAYIRAYTQDRRYYMTCTVTVKAVSPPEYVDLGLSVPWATFNVGATAPEEYGHFFAWGETVPKDYYDWATYKLCEGVDTKLTRYNDNPGYGVVDKLETLLPEDDAAQATWGGSWRMPTDREWGELEDKCKWVWTTENGVNGYRVTSYVSGYTDKSIFLPAAGMLIRADHKLDTEYGLYWSSSIYSDRTTSAQGRSFSSSGEDWLISARAGGLSVRPVYDRSIASVPVTSISLDQDKMRLAIGETGQLSATLSPANASNKTAIWSSSNNAIATVSPDGLVTAVYAGNATITATTVDGGHTATCEVTVTYDGVPVTGVSIQPASLNLSVGCGEALVWTVSPINATNDAVTWKSSNPSVAMISDGGRVFAKSPGTATITVTTVEGGFQATCPVTVNNAKPFEYVDLGLSVNWATFNVGASSEGEFGEYFAWGETDPKDEYRWETYKWCNGDAGSLTKYSTGNELLRPEDDAATLYWGKGWRSPSSAEMEELLKECSWTWTQDGPVSGYRVTSKKPGYTDKSIFLPAAGFYEEDNLKDVMTRGLYWSLSLASQPAGAQGLYLTSQVRATGSESRCFGFPIRPVIDKTVSVYSSHTKGTRPVTLCVLPDGYQESERALFMDRARKGMDFMFSVEPYKSMKEYFNVYFMWAPSAQSGASIIDDNGIFILQKSTAFSSRWNDSYSLMDANDVALFEFVEAHCPEIVSGLLTLDDVPILLMINDTRYGGICHSFPYGKAYCMVPNIEGTSWFLPNYGPSSDEPDGDKTSKYLSDKEIENKYGKSVGDYRNVVLHEFGGHAIGRLADEYWKKDSINAVAGVGIDVVWQSAPVPYGLNFSGWYNDDQVPWKELLDIQNQLTTNNPLYSRIGKFQGASVQMFNRWRSEEISCMIDNRPYYSTWQRYLIAKRVKELAGETLSLTEFLATDDPRDPLRDGNNNAVFAPALSQKPVKVYPPLPPPVLHAE